MAREYVDINESIKMLKDALRRNFPGVKFSVRRGRGTGYSTVRVSWDNGPSASMVDRVAQRYHGRDFDGMTDSSSYPTALLADAQGNVREVHFGIGFLFCDRSLPDGTREAVADRFAREFGADAADWQARRSSDHWAYQALESFTVAPGMTPEAIADAVWAQYRERTFAQ